VCNVRVGLRQFVEYTQQRLAGTTEAIVDSPAVAVGLYELCGFEPREMRRDCGGAQAESVGELGRGRGHGEERLQDGRPSGSHGGLQRRTVGRRGRGGPQLRRPPRAVGKCWPVAGLDQHLHARPGKDAGHQGYPTSRGLQDRLVGFVQLQGAPAVARLRVQAGEKRLHAAEGEGMPSPERFPSRCSWIRDQ
jgi:hypothetical protein